MHTRTLLAAVVALVLASCDRLEPPVDMQRVERTGFTLDVPAWPTGRDEDARTVGRYTVQQGRRLVEASWSASTASSVAELEEIGASIQKGFGFTLSDQSNEVLPDQIRLHLTFDIQGQGWAAMSMIQCIKGGVMVTLSVADERRGRAVALRDQVLASLVCPDDASLFASIWPRTNLPQDFGALIGESIVLGHRDGRWLMVAAVSASIVQNMSDSHQGATQILASFGGLIGSALKPMASASRGRTFSGPASVWYIEPDTMGNLVATTFICHEQPIGYLVLAGDENHASSHADLEALSLRFACPEGRARPSVADDLKPLLERPDVCDVGADALCESMDGAD